MWSHFKRPISLRFEKNSGYYSVNVITFGLAQNEHIKRLLLYSLCLFTEALMRVKDKLLEIRTLSISENTHIFCTFEVQTRVAVTNLCTIEVGYSELSGTSKKRLLKP